MIPKIIHYTWFSGEEFPPQIKSCIESWHKFLPDYQFKLWDMAAIADIDSAFLKETLESRKWAYASDFVRLYAVYKYGGIYLDTDVRLYRNFDDLLCESAFIGAESSIHYEGGMTEKYLSSHCFGAVPAHPYIQKCLSYYNGRNFIQSRDNSLPNTLKLNMVLLPYIQSEIAKSDGYDSSALRDEIQKLSDGLVIYPSHYFDAKDIHNDTRCVHLAVGSWREYDQYNPKATLAYKIQWRWQALIQKILGKKYTVIRLH